MSIVILGSFFADTTYRAARLPRMGETLQGVSFALGPGGKGSNQAVAAARLGGDVSFITRLGRDAFADMARGIWAGAGVKPVVIEDGESHTGAALIFVEDGSGDNAIIIAPGAVGRMSVADVEAQVGLISAAVVFVVQLEQPLEAATRGLEIARAAGAKTILNPAPARRLEDGILALVDFLTPNETEAELLTGLPVTNVAQAERAADALMARGVGAVVLTLGEKGVLYRCPGVSVLVPARTAGQVVETTGAGDAFHGGFAVGLAEGLSVEAAVRFGVAVAGISVTRAGAAASMPLRAEVEAFVAQT